MLALLPLAAAACGAGYTCYSGGPLAFPGHGGAPACDPKQVCSDEQECCVGPGVSACVQGECMCECQKDEETKGPESCTKDAPCYMREADYCTTYTCDKAKPDGQCLTFTNVCPCGAEYTKESGDDEKKACCGAGCPTHRDTALALVATYDHCMDKTLGDKCLNPKTGGCDNFVCAKGSWDHCEEYTNVCACHTVYVDGSKDQGKEACCGDGCPTHRDTALTLFIADDACAKVSCSGDKPCAAANGVCYELNDDHTCAPGTSNCVCPTTCAASKPCLQKSAGLCFELVGGQCPGGTQDCAGAGPAPGPVPKGDCDNICTDEAKPCAHGGVCFPKVGGVCPGGAKECLCKKSCTAAAPCGTEKSDACFPLVGGQCPGGTKVCANPSLALFI